MKDVYIKKSHKSYIVSHNILLVFKISFDAFSEKLLLPWEWKYSKEGGV